MARRGRPPSLDIYTDTGCSLSESCLRCPLPACRYDAPQTLKAERSAERDKERVKFMQDNNLSIADAARELGIDLRTMYRTINRARGA